MSQKNLLICYLCWVTADLSHTQLWFITAESQHNVVNIMLTTLCSQHVCHSARPAKSILRAHQKHHNLSIPKHPNLSIQQFVFFTTLALPVHTCLQLEVLDSCKAIVSYQIRAIHKQFLVSILKTLYFCFWLYCMVLLHWHNDRCQWCHIQSYHNGQCQYLFLQGLD